jgi:glycosyltransferase involved in cell wall biosynthesis
VNLLFVEERPRSGGGSERMSLALCQHAIRRGHQAWLVHEEAGDLVEAYRGAGATTSQLPVHPVAVRQPVRAWRSFSALRRLTSTAAIDVIVTSQVNYVSLVAGVGAVTDARTVVHLGLVYDYPSPVFHAGVRRVDLGVAPSEHTARGWVKQGWPAQSLRVIPNGVDTELFCPGDGRAAARRRLGLDRVEAPIIAYAGRLAAAKGIFTLLSAHAALCRGATRAHLLMVGNPMDGEADALRALAEREGLAPNDWQIRAAVAQVADVYRAADLVVVPSEWDEPFGLVPVESLACGTLAIVSDRGVLPSFVRAAGAEAVFPSGDAAMLQARLAYWLADTGRRERAAAAAAADVRARFAFEPCGDAYLAAFERLVHA